MCNSAGISLAKLVPKVMNQTNPYLPRIAATEASNERLAIYCVLLVGFWATQTLAYAYMLYGLSLNEVLAKLALALSVLPAWILSYSIAKRVAKGIYSRALVAAFLQIVSLANVLLMPLLVDACVDSI